MKPSPLWYRLRGLTILLITFLSFYLAYGISIAFHQSTEPAAWQLADGSIVRFRWIFAIGALFPIAAFLMRSWGAAYLHAAIVWAHDASAARLIIAGPFRYLRNPLYFGNILIMPWIALFMPPLGIPILAVASILFVAALANYEGELLHDRFGADYEPYALAVPALLPRFVPIPGDPLAPNADWGEGLRSEIFMLSFALLAVAIAIDPNLLGVRWIWAISLFAYFVQRALAGPVRGKTAGEK
ncbi:MAG: methyltransferase family protein [Candidatus Baltobacteraceae bacterium]